MRIGDSTTSTLHRLLGESTRKLSGLYRTLSSGQAYSRPSDGTASYSFLSRLRTKISEAFTRIQNLNQTQGLVQTLDVGLQSQSEVLQEMRELAVEASSQTLSAIDRERIATALQSLVDEFDRIAKDTRWNGIELLNSDQTLISEGIEIALEKEISTSRFKKSVGLGKFHNLDVNNALGLVNTSDLHTADLNGDGYQDFIVGDGGTSVIISLNNGSGDVSSYTSLDTESSSDNVQIGDVNGDGLVDIVTGGTGVDYFSVLLGTGGGNFSSAVTFDIDPSTVSAADKLRLADIDGDGNLDVLTSDSLTFEASVYFGDGTGSFSFSNTFSMTGVEDLQLGDINGDGKLDIVFTKGGFILDTPTYLLGNGDGTFGSETSVGGATTFYRGITLADIDNDGDLDILSGATGTSTLSIYKNNGSASFTRSTHTVGNSPMRTAVGDINRDGYLDIVTMNYSDGQFSLLLGNGTGSFTSKATAAISSFAVALTSIQLVDLDNDGVLDVAAADTTADSLNIRLSRPTSQTSLSEVTLSKDGDAELLLEIIDNALKENIERRAKVGSILNQLEIRRQSHEVTAQNLSDAHDLVSSPDIALLTAELVRTQILQQAQIASLAQAHLQANTVLQLLDLGI